MYGQVHGGRGEIDALEGEREVCIGGMYGRMCGVYSWMYGGMHRCMDACMGRGTAEYHNKQTTAIKLVLFISSANTHEHVQGSPPS